MLGTLDDGRLTLDEVHRFPNGPVRNGASLHWNIDGLFEGLKAGLQKAAQLHLPISSFSCDSWGVDYLLFDANGNVMAPTFHYRDPRAEQGVQNAYSRLKWETIFAETGIQFMPFNTLFQLAAESPDRLAIADKLLLVGDAFHFWLTGISRAEESLASTSQLYNPATRAWSNRLIETLGLPARLFPPVVPSGTRLGPLRKEISDQTGVPALAVVASCSHDTGAAVAAVPASEGTWAYISSGTWSLMGVELTAPNMSDACRDFNFTNEIGYGGSVRLLKNIIGLWMVQECRREWTKAGQELDYENLTRLAASAPAFRSVINPADPRFVSPGHMPEKIAAFCREHGEPVPENPGGTIRCVLESLALLYRQTFKQMEHLAGNPIERLHIVGGGSKNVLLNQFTANALQIPVIIGPVEATAAGNVLVQALALGHLPSLAAARQVVRDSVPLTTIEPLESALWETAYERFEALISLSQQA